MTVSMFDAYLERAYAVRATRMMDMSQATAYAASHQNGRTQLWNSWTQAISRSTTKFMQDLYGNTRHSIITWNGVPVNREELVGHFRRMFGKRAVTDDIRSR